MSRTRTNYGTCHDQKEIEAAGVTVLKTLGELGYLEDMTPRQLAEATGLGRLMTRRALGYLIDEGWVGRMKQRKSEFHISFAGQEQLNRLSVTA